MLGAVGGRTGLLGFREDAWTRGSKASEERSEFSTWAPPFSQSEACSIGVRVSVDLSIGTRWRKRKGAWDFRHDGIEDNFT